MAKHFKAPRYLALEPVVPNGSLCKKAGCFLVSVTAVTQTLRLLVLESVSEEVLQTGNLACKQPTCSPAAMVLCGSLVRDEPTGSEYFSE